MRQLIILTLALTGVLACGPDTSSSSGSSSGDAASSSSGSVSRSGGTGSSGGTSSSQCTPDTWASYAQVFFSNECASCHQHTGQFGSISAVNSNRSAVSTRISSGNMPPGSALAASDKQRILQWLNCTPLR